MIKLLHTADWQLGKPFASIQDPDKQSLVRQARIDAIEAVREAARAHEVEAVLVAGDLFDSPTVKAAVVSAALSAIGKIPCPVYAIPGNHDHGGPDSIWQQAFFEQERSRLAPNLEVCGTSEPRIFDTFALFPCPLGRRAESADTTAWLRDRDVLARVPENHPRIVLAHGSVLDFSSRSADAEDGDGSSNRIELDRLPWPEIDYLALGDWHGTKAVHPKAWYAGSPEYDRFPRGEDYSAGQALIVEVGRGAAPAVRAVSTGQLSWHEHQWTFHGDEDLVALEDWVEATFATRTQKDLLKLQLDGALGLEASRKLEELMDVLKARLLRLKLVNSTRLAPTEEELEALKGDTANPLTARVATALHRQIVDLPEQAETARLALRQLYLMRPRLSSQTRP